MMLLTILIAIFLIAGPVLILIASGYSLREVLSLTKVSLLKGSGGIYIEEIGDDAVIYLDNKETAHSSFLDRSILLQRLSPRAHAIRIEKAGFRPWEKSVPVISKRVTEIHPVLLSEKISFEKMKDESVLLELQDTLDEKEESIIATSTGNIILDHGRIKVGVLGRNIKVEWTNSEDAPQFMCQGEKCGTIEEIYMDESIKDLEWLIGGSDALVSVSNFGVYLVEMDSRGGRVIVPVLRSSDFGLSNFLNPKLIYLRGSLFLKTGETWYLISLEPKRA